MNPLFLSFVNFFVREILRIFKSSIALVSPKDLPKVQNLGNFLKIFPRLPRTGFIKKANPNFNKKRYKALTKSLNYFISNLPESDKVLTDRIRNAVLEEKSSEKDTINKQQNDCFLALSLNELASKKKRINLRLVIVGNSSTSLGILSHLLSLKDLIFNNIVLLSSEFIEQKGFLNVSPSEKCSEPRFLESLFLHNKIKLIQGHMVSLDRKQKSISIQDTKGEQFSMHYDYLVVTTGLVDKTKDYLEQKGVFNNVFVTELEKLDSSNNLINLSSNTSANLSMNPLINQSSQFMNDKSRKLSIHGIPDHFMNGNFQSVISQKAKNTGHQSSRNNFSNHSNMHQNDDDTLILNNTYHTKISTDFFVSVDEIQGDILRKVFAKKPLTDPSNLQKKELFDILEKERGWEGKLLHKKIPQNATLYGESPKIFALLESLLTDFDMDVSKISLILPPEKECPSLDDSDEKVSEVNITPESLLKTTKSNFANMEFDDNDKLLEVLDSKVDWPVMFDNVELRHFYLAVLQFFGINVLVDSDIMGLCEQENSILIRKGISQIRKDPKDHLDGNKKISKSKRSIASIKRTGLDLINYNENNKNQINSKFMNFVSLLKKFKYFFDFNMLSTDVVEDMMQKNPDLYSMLDDYNLDKKILGMIRTITDENSLSKNNSSLSNTTPQISMRKLQRKPFGLNSNVNEEGDDMIQDTIVFLGRTFDVGTSVFKAIQDNGLVFNGRLIVTNNFRTIDTFIYACGKISEFSQRYKNHALGRSLRVDKFDGFEVGNHFASQFVSLLRDIPFQEGKIVN
jgi:hypothetical protein